MSYAGTLAIHDADSHILETPGMLHDFADPDIRERLDPQYFFHAIGSQRILRTSLPIAAIMPIRFIAVAMRQS